MLLRLKKWLMLPLLGLCGLFLFAACAPVQFLNGITPTGSYSKIKNVSYGPLKRQKLDMYRAERPKANTPILVYIHGGGWTDGSKDIYKFLAQGFTSEGYDIAVPNYRLHPEGKYPMMLEDSAKAVAYIARENPDRPLLVMGHSAGGYNSLMIAMDDQYMKAEGVDICRHIAGIVSLAGPTGVYPLKEEPYITIFPDRFTGTDAPIHHVKGSMPAVFFGHGSDDDTVHPKNSETLAQKITERGGRATYKLYDGMSHTGAAQVLSNYFDGKQTLKDDIISFASGLTPDADGSFCR